MSVAIQTPVPDSPGWLGLEAPRYTSYPSAHHFSPQLDESDYRRWLNALASGTPVSLYVHIPYCREMCWFCGCHTKATHRYEPVARYVQTLRKEIALLKQALPRRPLITQIHFGGGSPSLLRENDLTDILSDLALSFEIDIPGELAIELDPRTATARHIEHYARLGFNRISIGIQDFDPTVQAAINRIQPYPMVCSLMQRIGREGISRVNCDLVYGLPHQTPARFRDTLEKTMALNPSRIALFSYAHMPQLKKHQRLIDTNSLPSEHDKLALYSMACEMLGGEGYIPIGIDHFARAGDALARALHTRTLRRNFQGYVCDRAEMLIGIGSSAISQLPQGYAQNSAKTPDYIERVEAGMLPVARGWSMTGDDRLRKAVIDELMCFLSADVGDIARRFGAGADYFSTELAALSLPSYGDIVRVSERRVEVIGPYRMAARAVAAVFDRYHAQRGNYSKVA